MLKSKLTGMLGAALIVAAINAVAVSSAAAAVFTLTTTACTGGTNVALCYETETTKDELTGEQSVLVEGGTVVFTAKVSPEQKIECTKSSGSGTIVQTEPLTAGKKTTFHGKFLYTGCKLTTEPKKKCVVNENNETFELEGTLESESELKAKPKAGEILMTITYSNNGTETCPATFLGEHGISGTQSMEVVNPGTPSETGKAKAIGRTLKFFSAEGELSQEMTMSFENTEGKEKLGDVIYVSKVA
jgi:hypothetical protein